MCRQFLVSPLFVARWQRLYSLAVIKLFRCLWRTHPRWFVTLFLLGLIFITLAKDYFCFYCAQVYASIHADTIWCRGEIQCVCVCVCVRNENKIGFPCRYEYTQKGQRPYVCMFAYVLAWAPPLTIQWVMTGECCSRWLKLDVQLSAQWTAQRYLIIHDLEKGWGLPFSLALSLSPSLPRSLLLACVWSPGREVEVGWELPASPPSACHCVSHRAAGRLSYLLGFSWACVRVHAVHNIRRHRSGRCTVTCSLTGTLTQSFSYFPHRCLKLTLTYASTPPALPKHEFN